MPIAPLANIQIEDKDIDEVEKLFRNISFDDTRRNVIKRLDTFDIQAFPGSGKTTLLIAKLAILAKKWTYTNRGICVLSHTNVAREEIETRLGTTGVGRKLFSYPHYIGTLHSFCDTFIGLPWLRSKNIKISAIDPKMTLTRRWAKLPRKTKSYLERKHFTESACESLDFPVKLNIRCKETTESYINLKKCVEQSFREGYFTFDEMLYIARYALKNLPTMPHSIQYRFPILLIDEAQDTDSLQWEIIDAAFPDETASIINSFGDCNQAIFQTLSTKDEKSAFPRKEVETVKNSKRFSNKIAQLANPLSIDLAKMTGECEKFAKNNLEHTIFLFKNEEISRVLPVYAKHVLSCFTDDELLNEAHHGCHAIGLVHNKEMETLDNSHFPSSVIDYWNNYNSSISGSNPNPEFLIEYFRIGNALQQQTLEKNKLVETVAQGLKRYINTQTTTRISHSRHAFASILSFVPLEEHARFRTIIKDSLEMPISSEDEWDKVALKIRELIDGYFGISSGGSTFFSWVKQEKIDEIEEEDGNQKLNCYNYTDPETGRAIDIRLGSIHSVKGRTHLATLVLETYWYKHNIKDVLPWLYATPPSNNVEVRKTKRLKCLFVALTRAKGLICLALPQSSVNEEEISKLELAGWKVTPIN
ncbi:MAG: UvrD-helicase domain-containing protein [Anaerolineaceae bacterium]|nr:UvrD-helicase domain-containing protein [Anaerolineaceae bacterium]